MSLDHPHERSSVEPSVSFFLFVSSLVFWVCTTMTDALKALNSSKDKGSETFFIIAVKNANKCFGLSFSRTFFATSEAKSS